MPKPLDLRGKRGIELLYDPGLNKGTAFTELERDALGLRGLLPPRAVSEEAQLARVLENFRGKTSDLEKYIFMVALQDRNETLFYRVVTEYLEEMLPIIYTPTVGQGCLEFGHIFRRSRGLYVSFKEKGRIAEVFRNWPHKNVRIIVVTDGERILGLGDLGANGMGIPVGKLALYTACAGIDPSLCLPVMLDVGTNNEALLADPLYIGHAARRLRGAAYDELVGEFFDAARAAFPKALIQLEDFGNTNAFRLLENYRERACTFDDDIQGTAAVALAGILSALRITGNSLTDHKFLFFGAGEAGIGIADLIVSALTGAGLAPEDARRRCWFFDSKGLVVESRKDLAHHKLPYAHPHARLTALDAAIEALRPTALIGVSGMGGAFTSPVLEAMARHNSRPIVFALSNPTSKSECSAQDAYRFTGGKALFAGGSPFGAVVWEGKTFTPGQGNNVYIFPGVGLGVMVSDAERVSEAMFFAAARTVASLIGADELDQGRLFPSLERIREVSLEIAVAVAEIAYRDGLTRSPRPADLRSHVRDQMYVPRYRSYV